jgi:DNA-binding CsgD family transcriptional regulator
MKPHTIIDALRTRSTRDPEELRSYALEAIRELAASTAAAWLRFGLVDGVPLPARWMLRGMAPITDARELARRIPWRGDPRLPDPRWNRRIVVVPAIARGDTVLGRLSRTSLPALHQLRLVVYHRGQFVAWIGALRGPGERPFDRADVRRVTPIAGVLADALIAAEEAERARTPAEGIDIVLGACGSVELASDSAGALLALPGFDEELCAWARAAREGGTPPSLLRGYRVRWTQLSGAGGNRHLLRLEPIPALRLHPTHVLSDMQREIAELAAAGATGPEIARMKALAPATVRAHLRQIYERLDVACRAELARVLQGTEALQRTG